MSKLYFATEARFIKRNGTYYTLGAGFTKILWERYLEYFSELRIIARVNVDESITVNDSMKVADERISFIEIPYYIGFMGFLKQRNSIKTILKEQLRNDGIYLCRLPGNVGSEVISVLNENRIRYSCEVVGNPWDVFAKGSINHPLRPLLRRISTYLLKKQLRNACAALYVTQKTLQAMYPVKDGVFNVGVSDVIIKDADVAQIAKTLVKKQKYRLISVGSLEQLYKAPDIVLRALKQIIDKGFDCELLWLGEGIYKKDMIELATSLSITNHVFFAGSVSASQVLSYLRGADIFLLVSRTEGLPRALVEAMAQGLPCIGSNVGGIPELLSSEVLVEKDDVDGLVLLIEKMLSDPEFTDKQAKQNLIEAQQYKESELVKIRSSFYKYLSNIQQ